MRTEFILDYDNLKFKIDTLTSKDIEVIKIYDIINESYKINYGEVFQMKKYICELTKQSLNLRRVDSKFYPYFDVVLCLLFLKKNHGIKGGGKIIEEADERFRCLLNRSLNKIKLDKELGESLERMENKEV